MQRVRVVQVVPSGLCGILTAFIAGYLEHRMTDGFSTWTPLISGVIGAGTVFVLQMGIVWIVQSGRLRRVPPLALNLPDGPPLYTKTTPVLIERPELTIHTSEKFKLEFRATVSGRHSGKGWLTSHTVTRTEPFDLKLIPHQYIAKGRIGIIEIAKVQFDQMEVCDRVDSPFHRAHSERTDSALNLRIEIWVNNVEESWTYHYRFWKRGREIRAEETQA